MFNVFLYLAVFIAINGLFIILPMELFESTANILETTIGGDAKLMLFLGIIGLTGFAVILAGIIMFRGYHALIKWFWIAMFPVFTLIVSWLFGFSFIDSIFGIGGNIVYALISAAIVFGIIYIKRFSSNRETKKSQKMENFKSFSRNYLFPVLTALVFIVWHETILSSSVKQLINTHSPVNMENIIYYLLLSGFIPIRILIMFTPPIKPVNIGISLVSFYIYFASLDSVLGRLTEALLK